jgi:hypothetical protein
LGGGSRRGGSSCLDSSGGLLLCRRSGVVVIRIILTHGFQNRLTNSVKTSLHRFLKRLLVPRAAGRHAVFLLVAENVSAAPGHLVQILPDVRDLRVVVAGLARCKVLLFFAPLGIQKLDPDVLADVFRPGMLGTLRKLNTNNLIPGVRR